MEDVESPVVATKRSRYWNRQICYACFTLALMAASFAAIYCGVKFGLAEELGEKNITSNEDGILISPRTTEINPSTPLIQTFTQPINGSTNVANGNVSYITEKIPASSSHCSPRNTTFCSNHLNYTDIAYPNFAGDESEDDFIGSWDLLQTVVDSFCHPMIEQFICLATQPECRQDGKSLGPCRQFCHELAKACVSHLWSVLEKERILFDCDKQYVDSDDPNLCYNTMPMTSNLGSFETKPPPINS